MSRIDPDGLEPTLEARLRAELERIQPPHTTPRYLAARTPVRAWRLAPVMLAIACTGIVALTAFAATGSPNPAVWTNRVETVINPPSPSPSPVETPTPTQPPAAAVAAPSNPPAHEAEPTASPQHESPEPSDTHDGSGSSDSSTPSPTPSPSGDR